jgi:hypothetical protein
MTEVETDHKVRIAREELNKFGFILISKGVDKSQVYAIAFTSSLSAMTLKGREVKDSLENRLPDSGHSSQTAMGLLFTTSFQLSVTSKKGRR